MKNPANIHLGGEGFFLDFEDSGNNSFTLKLADKKVAVIGRTQCANFSEGGGLVKKFRRHDSVDGLSAQVESIIHIPFGCEFEIKRQVEVTTGFAALSTDIMALSGGKVGDIALETIHFPFLESEIKYLVYGENQWRENVDYCGSEPVIFFQITLADKTQIEFYSGDDLWRHRSAIHTSGTQGEFSISRNDQGVTLERKVLKYVGDTEAEKRPWRFSGLLAWHTVDMDNIIPENGNKFVIPGCFRSANSRREFRNMVRKSGKGEILHLQNITPGICEDSSHLERSGKTLREHGDLLEYVGERLWANRQLMKRNSCLYMSCLPNNLWSKSVAAANLSTLPKQLFKESD